MERNDLLTINGGIFGPQGEAIAAHAASDVRVFVVGNPCNTNCLIARAHAPEIPDDRFFAMTRLDQNRAQSLLAHKAGVPVASVTSVAIWGNHSATQYPDFENARIDGRPVPAVIEDADWLRGEFITTVQQRGAADHRGPGRLLGGIGGQRRGRLGALHRAADGGRRLRVAGGRVPRRVRQRPRDSSSGSPSGPTDRRGTWWKASSTATSPATASGSRPKSSSPSAPRCGPCSAERSSDGCQPTAERIRRWRATAGWGMSIPMRWRKASFRASD